MLARSVHHVSFAVRDLARSQRFYAEILGLEPIKRPDLGLAGAWYRTGNAEIHLIATPEGIDVGSAPPNLTPLANHQAFAVEDYAKSLDFLEARQVEVLRTTPETGQLWIRDPDGNVIELIAPRS